MKTILVIEDEVKLNEIICDYLKEAGFKTLSAFDGENALDLFETESVDGVILDIMIPKIDGWSVCRKIRKTSGIPIIMLTARGEEDDKLMGFELGADEYVTKPFSPKVLVARASRLLTRIKDTSVELGSLSLKGILWSIFFKSENNALGCIWVFEIESSFTSLLNSDWIKVNSSSLFEIFL